MGIFPIIMNIVQFWTIDSIVKASMAATAAQDVESAHQDQEPLFNVPAEDDDDQPPPRLEIPNRSSSRHSVPPLDPRDLEPHTNTPSQTTITISDEHKSGASSSRCPVDAYAYPPSLSSSISSDHSFIPNHHKGPNSVNKKYRDHSPALRSANPSSKSPLIPRTPSPQNAPFAIAQDHDVWEGIDDWDKHISTIPKRSPLSTKGSWRNTHSVDQQHLRLD